MTPDETIKAEGGGRVYMPPDAVDLLARLGQAGHKAYAVGGCVRDSLLGLTPCDWDIATSARPEETEACFRDCRVIDTGKKHGTLTVIYREKAYEITTFRVDGPYSDRRRPDHIAFTGDLRADAARRDFTINAMAAEADGTVHDFFGGREDLRRRLIRAVGDPSVRFSEDALRILRALRFAAALDFDIEEGTGAAILSEREKLCSVAAERITEEFRKLLCGRSAGRVLSDYRPVAALLFPSLEAASARERLKLLDRAPRDLLLRLLLLFNGDIADLSRLRLEKAVMKELTLLSGEAGSAPPAGLPSTRRLVGRTGRENARRLGAFWRLTGEEVDGLDGRLREIEKKNLCCSLSDLAVGGKELLPLGFERGRELGLTLERLLEAVIEGKLENRPPDLLQEAARLRAC